MIWVGCPNCKSEAIYKYSLDFSVMRGFTNPCNHLVSCVGSNDNMVKIVQACQNAKLLEKDQDERSKAVSKQPVLQQTLSTYNFIPSEAILSIHMWITKIVMKNMTIYFDIECEVEREMVRSPKLKTVKTVLDTLHHLVAIVEDKSQS
jgi:hypothetical protein